MQLELGLRRSVKAFAAKRALKRGYPHCHVCRNVARERRKGALAFPRDFASLQLGDSVISLPLFCSVFVRLRSSLCPVGLNENAMIAALAEPRRK